MAGADDHVALQLAVGEGALLVRARVLECDPAGGGAAEADGGSVHLDPAEGADVLLLRRADAVPGELAHRPMLERGGLAGGLEAERLVEGRDAVVLGGVRGRIVDLVATRVTRTITNQMSARTSRPIVQ